MAYRTSNQAWLKGLDAGKVKVKVKQSRYRPGVAQRVPVS
jgi:hypothetical protein